VFEMCRFSEPGLARFKNLVDTNTLSTRSMDRLAKVSRTVADLATSEEVQPVHMDTAASYVVGGILREAF